MSKDMSNKVIVMLSIAVGIFAIPVIIGVLFFSFLLKTTENQIIVAVINPKVNIEDVKEDIIKIPHIKKIFIEYKDEQYSDIYDEMDNYGLGAKYKDQVKIKVDKQKNLNKVFEEVSSKEYVDKANYLPDTEVFDGVGRAFRVGK